MVTLVSALASALIMLSFGAPGLASTLANRDPSETTTRGATHRPQVPSSARSSDAGAPVTHKARHHFNGAVLPAPGTMAVESKPAKTEKPAKAHGHGPPAWAHANGRRAHATGHQNRERLDAWKALTQQQRTAKMTALTRAHTAGMKKWAHCRAAGRVDCVRPMPPGQAKRG